MAQFLKCLASAPLGVQEQCIPKGTDVMTHKKVPALAILATAVIILGSFQTSSQARSVMAASGRAVAAADYSCFTVSYASMTNVCSTSKTLVVPLPASETGSFTVTVNAQGPSTSSNVGCRAIGTDESITTLYGVTTFKWLSIFGAPQDIPLDTYRPTGGGLYVECIVYPNGRVNTINW